MAPTTGRGADLPTVSLRIGSTAFYLCFPHNPEKPNSRITSVLSSAAVVAGCEESNDRRRGEMAPHSSESSLAELFLLALLRAVLSVFLFASLRGTRRSRKPLSVLCRVSAVRLSNFARRACTLAAASLIFCFTRSLWRHLNAAT